MVQVYANIMDESNEYEEYSIEDALFLSMSIDNDLNNAPNRKSNNSRINSFEKDMRDKSVQGWPKSLESPPSWLKEIKVQVDCLYEKMQNVINSVEHSAKPNLNEIKAPVESDTKNRVSGSLESDVKSNQFNNQLKDVARENNDSTFNRNLNDDLRKMIFIIEKIKNLVAHLNQQSDQHLLPSVDLKSLTKNNVSMPEAETSLAKLREMTQTMKFIKENSKSNQKSCTSFKKSPRAISLVKSKNNRLSTENCKKNDFLKPEENCNFNDFSKLTNVSKTDSLTKQTFEGGDKKNLIFVSQRKPIISRLNQNKLKSGKPTLTAASNDAFSFTIPLTNMPCVIPCSVSYKVGSPCIPVEEPFCKENKQEPFAMSKQVNREKLIISNQDAGASKDFQLNRSFDTKSSEIDTSFEVGSPNKPVREPFCKENKHKPILMSKNINEENIFTANHVAGPSKIFPLCNNFDTFSKTSEIDVGYKIFSPSKPVEEPFSKEDKHKSIPMSKNVKSEKLIIANQDATISKSSEIDFNGASLETIVEQQNNHNSSNCEDTIKPFDFQDYLSEMKKVRERQPSTQRCLDQLRNNHLNSYFDFEDFNSKILKLRKKQDKLKKTTSLPRVLEKSSEPKEKLCNDEIRSKQTDISKDEVQDIFYSNFEDYFKKLKNIKLASNHEEIVKSNLTNDMKNSKESPESIINAKSVNGYPSSETCCSTKKSTPLRVREALHSFVQMMSPSRYLGVKKSM